MINCFIDFFLIPKEKRTPPIGAPNAAATPAAAPPETKSLFSWSFRKYLNILRSNLKLIERKNY